MKAFNIITWVLTILLAVAFFGSGVTKLIGVEMQVQNIQSWGFPDWFRYPVGLGEIALAIALIFFKPKSFVMYGIYIWAFVAILTHLQAGQTEMTGGPLVFALLNTVLLLSWKKSKYAR
ncbi:DoxX family protein [Pontibacter sp. 13R65]|uniref:DoxX family protein n=1 Tax=Pontibacter sp. 13R65 TaxID=3127458 RepID=UPI00301D0381